MKKLFLLGLIAVSTFLTAQKMKVTSGSFAALKGITLYDVTFDYSNLKVDKFKTEEDFLKDKMKKEKRKEQMMISKSPGLLTEKTVMNQNLSNLLTKENRLSRLGKTMELLM
jgi:hypothetical protein